MARKGFLVRLEHRCETGQTEAGLHLGVDAGDRPREGVGPARLIVDDPEFEATVIRPL
jgi:hypothetical protein